MIERLSPNGAYIASGAEEGTVKVRSAIIGTACWSIPKAHRGTIRVIAWSPDGAAIASGGDDAIINVWEATTGTAVALYAEHTGPIAALDWSPDSCWITSVDETGNPHVWQPYRDNTPDLKM
jgi:WD40 repeat protein